MAMEVRRVLTGPDGGSAHDGHILCVAYNPLRREISTGSQDTTIKTWLSETGEHVRTLREHNGWVTGLAFSPELRVLFSCSIDGRLLVWSKADCLQKEKVGCGKGAEELGLSGSGKGGPLHCLAWDARRHSLVVGASGHIWVYSAIPETEMTIHTRVVIKLQSLLKDAHSARGPEDALVRGIICTDSGKLYSVGYDRMLVTWDTDSTKLIAGGGAPPKKGGKKGGGGGSPADGPPQLRKVGQPLACHDAAISAVTFDPDNNWIITGSFDRQVKIWAGDSKKPVAIIDEKTGINDTVTGLAYCPATKTLWMASNSTTPVVYDPRSATDITPFLQLTESANGDAKGERIQKIFRIKQTGAPPRARAHAHAQAARVRPARQVIAMSAALPSGAPSAGLADLGSRCHRAPRACHPHAHPLLRPLPRHPRPSLAPDGHAHPPTRPPQVSSSPPPRIAPFSSGGTTRTGPARSCAHIPTGWRCSSTATSKSPPPTARTTATRTPWCCSRAAPTRSFVGGSPPRE